MRILLLLVLTIINLLRALVLNIECTGLCYFLNSCQRHRSIRILNEQIMITSTKFQMIRLYDYWSNFQGKWKRLDLRTIYGLPIGLGLHAAAATWSRVFYLWWPSWDLTVPGGGNWLLMQTFNQSNFEKEFRWLWLNTISMISGGRIGIGISFIMAIRQSDGTLRRSETTHVFYTTSLFIVLSLVNLVDVSL